MDSNNQSLQFGIELELLLGGRKKTFPSWKTLADDVSKRLAKVGIRNHVRHDKTSHQLLETYREWTLVQEVTIQNKPQEGLWGIELVSPVYPVACSWAVDLATIFSIVQETYIVVQSVHCSTHVHVSGNPQPLSIAAVTRLAEAALIFEPALDALMPPVRRLSSTYWCRSNRASQLFEADKSEGGLVLPLVSCLERVRQGYEMATHAAAEAVNLLSPDCAYGRAHGKKYSFVHGKVFKWNFGPFQASGGLGTIEFRQPPGSLVAEDACAWVTLTLAFVAGVTLAVEATAGDEATAAVLFAGGHDSGDDCGASLAELWQVLQMGAVELGWADLRDVESLFRNGSDM